jgi:voltage-gated potassium channel
MLKSLGISMSQIAQRLRPPSSEAGTPRTSSALTRRADRIQLRVSRLERRRQVRSIIGLILAFTTMVAVFSTLFHVLMEREERSYSWATSVYWTLTTMTTLGFGDITFTSDAGRLFSVVVLLAGSTFLLVMLPFIFIQFVFMPWMAERDRRKAPRQIPASTRGHLVLTELGPVEAAVIERASQAGVPYVLLVEDPERAARLHDEGRRVMVGDLDDPTTYINARVTEAAMVVASRNDRTNTNIAFTVREIAPEVLIIATANDPAAVDILEIAGADHVVQLGEILGSAMAARTLGPDGRSHVIGEFAGLMIAEASVSGTSLVGHTLAEAQLRAGVGVGIIGVWDRGRFTVATGDTVLGQSTVLLLAGTQPQLDAYDAAYSSQSPEVHHMVIIGGGRVGRAAGQAFAAEGLSYTIVERLAEREHEGVSYVIGDAADRTILEAAGIDRGGAILITTHDDDVNVYLTRYCRGLRPDVRIVSRAKLDRNVSTLYRAGADAVLSYAGSCSAAIWNHFRGEETLLVAQGLNLFRTRIPKELAGKSLAESHLYRRTRCNVVAVVDDQGIHGNPDAHQPLPAGGELVVIGTEEAEASFCETFPNARSRVRSGSGVGQTVR